MLGSEEESGNCAKTVANTNSAAPIINHFWKVYMLPLAMLAAGGW